MAAKADRHELYEQSVQAPKVDAATLARIFKRYRKRPAMSLREDFCGTAVLSTAWAKSKRGRSAIGVDLDQPTMDWGYSNRIEPAGVTDQVTLHRANVLDGVGPKVDLAAGLNFSYNVLHERSQLLEYFKAARTGLVDDGMLILDVFGGWGTMKPETFSREVRKFTYRWVQRSFDPLTHRIVCAICFDFPDGSRIEDAFYYDWRLWTCPEIRETLYDAGFSRVRLLWERTDDEGDGTGKFYEPKKHVDNEENFWTYIVAER